MFFKVNNLHAIQEWEKQKPTKLACKIIKYVISKKSMLASLSFLFETEHKFSHSWLNSRSKTKRQIFIANRMRPSVEFDYLFELLAFQEAAKCREFLDECNVVYSNKDRSVIDCKNSFAAMNCWYVMYMRV